MVVVLCKHRSYQVEELRGKHLLEVPDWYAVREAISFGYREIAPIVAAVCICISAC